jgi:hypothetical protein
MIGEWLPKCQWRNKMGLGSHEGKNGFIANKGECEEMRAVRGRRA